MTSSTGKTPLVVSPCGRKYSTSGIWKLVRHVAHRAGIVRPVSPHWLRHTFATLAEKAGATVYELQRTLGHRHLSTTQRYVNMANDLETSAARFVGFE